MSSNGTGLSQVYVAELQVELPHVNQKAEASEPKFPDEIGKFREQYEGDEVLQQRLRNKVLVCEQCGKPNAITKENCNSCGASLSGVPITFNDNIFMGFVYGIQKGPRFPYVVSMRKQTENLLCFDDPLTESVLHLIAIPTDVYIPDLRYLFANPQRGLKLIVDLFDIACNAALEMFWSDDAFRKTFFGDEAPPADASGVAEFVLSGCNYPPSMYQLHLQFTHPPMLPFYYALVMQGNHLGHGRYFPYDYLRKALALGDAVKMEIQDDTNIADIVSKITDLGVNYDVEHAALLRKCRRIQERFKAWDDADFSCRVMNGKVFSGEKLEELPDKDPQAIRASDMKQMQTYGRPYDANGKPTGTYYRFAKNPEEVGSWP